MNNAPATSIRSGRRPFRSPLTGIALALVAAAGMTTAPAYAGSADAPVKLLLRWYDTMPDDSLHNTQVQVAFHDGQFDVFDLDRPLPTLLAE